MIETLKSLKHLKSVKYSKIRKTLEVLKKLKHSGFPGSSEDDMWHLQTPELIHNIEQRSWQGLCHLGVFEDGKVFVWLTFLPAAPVVTPFNWLKGSFWEGVPYHVTLGHSPDPEAMHALRTTFTNVREFTVSLKKMSWDRSKTGYEVTGGSLLPLLERAHALGFRPRTAWHISL